MSNSMKIGIGLENCNRCISRIYLKNVKNVGERGPPTVLINSSGEHSMQWCSQCKNRIILILKGPKIGLHACKVFSSGYHLRHIVNFLQKKFILSASQLKFSALLSNVPF